MTKNILSILLIDLINMWINYFYLRRILNPKSKGLPSQGFDILSLRIIVYSLEISRIENLFI
jgi:hypothetical protein